MATWNWILILMAVMVVFAVTTAPPAGHASGNSGWTVNGQTSNVRIVRDLETGCEYIAFDGGLTPRLWPTGTPRCLLWR
jgi:hypothetical protein